MNPTPFRVLFREFLFRAVDLDLLSRNSDLSRLLGQIAALLVFVSIGLAIPAMGVASGSNLPPMVAQILTWSGEHFMIAITMLVTGILAVLTWDSTYPNRRDVFVLSPLPLPVRTIFLAKVAAAAAALGLTVAALHLFAGFAWPAALFAQSKSGPALALTYEPAIEPTGAGELAELLNREMQRAQASGSGAFRDPRIGVTVGILQHRSRRILTYGAAHPDSIYEIGSITKTFTGLLLARSVVREHVSLRQPVRELLPPSSVSRPGTREITLLDLATHRSGLPSIPDNLRVTDASNPVAGYGKSDLYEFLGRHGVARPANAPFEYSNVGFSLLGQALADRAGASYEDLIRRDITEPLGMKDTGMPLQPEQQSRAAVGVSMSSRDVSGWDLAAFTPAGGIRSTAGDMLTYLDAQLHPGRLTPRDFEAAIRESHRIQNTVAPGMSIALGWMHDDRNGAFWHNGATGGFSSYSFFDPKHDSAGVVLSNQAVGLSGFAGLLGEHIRARLAGDPAISLESVTIPPAAGAFALVRFFAVYWVVMLASGAWVYCAMLAVQGIASQLLPRRLFLRASAALQLSFLVVLLGGFMFLPTPVTPITIIQAQNGGWLYWSPTYWFLGLFQQLIGSPALAPLAARAWIALAGVIGLTAAAYTLSYVRTIRQIVEEPDIGGRRVRTFIPVPGRSLTAVIAGFSLRTLFRSRKHRLILAFYWGIALAVIVFLTKAPSVQAQLNADDDPWRQANVPLLMASVLLLCSAIVGMRIAISLPCDLGANWVFRHAPIEGGPATMSAVRRAFYLIGAVPVWAGTSAAAFCFWPAREAAGHTAVLICIGIFVTELCLYRFHKIPFTCSYLPGKSQANMAVLAYLGVVLLMVKGAAIERSALKDGAQFSVLISGLIVAALGAWWRTSGSVRAEQPVLRFEDELAPAVNILNLNGNAS